jgi:hypothetical protein
MLSDDKYTIIANKLRDGQKFGMFDKGMKCFFDDGSQVNYNDLWKAIALIHKPEEITGKSLTQLFPTTFTGVHQHKHRAQKWGKKSIFSFLGL